MSEDGRQLPLAEAAYRRIEEMIVTRVLKPGAMISEKRLADEVECGRTPVREALQRLRLEGYIEVHPSRGVQVSTIDIFRQFELLEVRRPLEDLMVRLAAERATLPERASMTQLAQAIAAAAAARDRRAFLIANRSIHETLAAAARNTVLANSMRGLHGLSRRFWFAYIEDEDIFDEAARLHGATLKATAAQDGKAAAANAATFLDFLESLTRKALKPGCNRYRPAPEGHRPCTRKPAAALYPSEVAASRTARYSRRTISISSSTEVAAASLSKVIRPCCISTMWSAISSVCA